MRTKETNPGESALNCAFRREADIEENSDKNHAGRASN